jgi:2-polyprenyl-3-methyl-5-hydroxy-6-metoxy-1,4-benzoquinol methylase
VPGNRSTIHPALSLPAVSDFPCWCGRGDWRVRFRTPRFGLVRCIGCGCYRIDPPPLESEEQSSDFYTEYYAGRTGEGEAESLETRLSRYWGVVRQVAALSHVGQTAVDIGCGDGRLCAELRAAGWPDVTGLDVSSTRIARARHLYPEIRFEDRPLEATDIARGSVDLAVMDNVIEHLPDPRRTVGGIRGYLSGSGRLVLITPNMESGHFSLLGRRWTPELAPHAHIFLFTADSLRELLQQAGYEVEAVGSFHLSFYPLGAWLSRLASGDVRGSVWRAVQEMGGLYGRLKGAGEMLYAVARAAPGGTT